MERFGVARMTVRQALDALVSEGVLERFPGRGTFVAQPRREPSRISSLTEDLAERGLLVESRTLVAQRVHASPAVARALAVSARETVLQWRRVRLVDGNPVCLSEAYINESLVPGLLEGDLPDSLYGELGARGRRPTWAEDSVSAGRAEREEADLLGCPVGAVVLRHARRALWGDHPIEVSRSVYPGDVHTVSLRLGG